MIEPETEVEPEVAPESVKPDKATDPAAPEPAEEPGAEDGQSEAPEPEPEASEAEAVAETKLEADAPESPTPAAPEPASVPPAFIIGGGVLPVWSLRTLLNRPGRTVVRELHHPGDGPAEPGYRPSPKLAEFIRCRDLTCRFPGVRREALVDRVEVKDLHGGSVAAGLRS